MEILKFGLAILAKTLPKFSLGFFPFCLIGKFMESDICYFICRISPKTPTQGFTNQTPPTTSHARLVLTCVMEGDFGECTIALTTAMIGLATLTMGPVWMRHGCRVVRGLKKNHKQQLPQLFPGDFGRAGRIANL